MLIFKMCMLKDNSDSHHFVLKVSEFNVADLMLVRCVDILKY